MAQVVTKLDENSMIFKNETLFPTPCLIQVKPKIVEESIIFKILKFYYNEKSCYP